MNLSPRRRRLLIGAVALAAAGVLGWPAFRRTTANGLPFVALQNPPGFRRIAGGEVSAAGKAAADSGDMTTPDDLCRALFGVGHVPVGTVPIAYFSDYRCPFCRRLTPRLAAIKASAAGIHIASHEWPILGEASETAARAALAARRQGAHAAMHARLIEEGSPPTREYLEDLARSLGLDPARLLADMERPEVEQEIERTRQLAALLGFRGTPGLVVGRTVVNAAIEEPLLGALIELERREGPPPGCRGR